MTVAFVDTTILANVTLKAGTAVCRQAKEALGRYDRTLLPMYAIKEFKRGPLGYFVWLHNKLVLTRSYAKTLAAVKGVMRQSYRVATAFEALEQAHAALGRATLGELQRKYGAQANPDSVLCDQMRLSIKTFVLKAWERRRKIASEVVQPLSCYREEKPFTKDGGLLDLEPKTCRVVDQCCLAERLKADPESLQKLAEAVERQGGNKREHSRRLKVLRTLLRKPRAPMSEQMCRDLGDAYFAFFAPLDSTILTTNLADHVPLAEALGKKAAQP